VLRFCRGSNFAISRWLGLLPSTQCWCYRAPCDSVLEIPTTGVVIIACVTWTIQNDYSGYGDTSSSATTVEDCRTECSNNRDCTAIDWVVGASTGSQCWLVGSWTTWSGYRPGIQRHTISRTCDSSGCTFAWIEYCVILAELPLVLSVNMKWKIWTLPSVKSHSLRQPLPAIFLYPNYGALHHHI